MVRLIPRRLLTSPKASIEAIHAGPAASTATVRIDGLVCSAYASNVRAGFERMDGVRSADVDLDGGLARVEYDPSRVAPADLVTTVECWVLFPGARALLASLTHRPT